jgi:pSer/pThr/pTyr-binding forkhead associated (FHA) protein
MPKLVILNQGLTGQSHELKAERTTIGRVEDNMFQISEPSVSSHHCEVVLRGKEVVIRDLNSTNGTFINNQKIAESVLPPGQKLRLGNVELWLDTGAGGAAPAPTAPTTPAAPPPSPPKKTVDNTLVIPRGVSLGELEKGGRPPGFDTASKEFSKKRRGAPIFWIIAIVVLLVIGCLIVYLVHLVH